MWARRVLAAKRTAFAGIESGTVRQNLIKCGAAVAGAVAAQRPSAPDRTGGAGPVGRELTPISCTTAPPATCRTYMTCVACDCLSHVARLGPFIGYEKPFITVHARLRHGRFRSRCLVCSGVCVCIGGWVSFRRVADGGGRWSRGRSPNRVRHQQQTRRDNHPNGKRFL